MKEFIDPDWQELLEKHGLASFEELWNRQDPWFEEPNSGRSKDGWSGVCRFEISGRVLFLKKQENFFTYSLKSPMGESVVVKEYSNLALFNDLSIPCMKVVYFGVRKNDAKVQGLIVTEALEDYISVHEAIEKWQVEEISVHKRRKIIYAVADLVRDAHEKGVMHNSLYPKHIFIDAKLAVGEPAQQKPLCRFIDLEKAKKAKPGSKKQLRDLETLNRRCKFWSRTERLAFLLHYLGLEKSNLVLRRFLRKLKSVSKK
jgi:hypothetical protein